MSVNLVVTNAAGDDIWLDLYEEQPIKLTFNIEDILTIKPKAEFTRQFRIPATDTNYDFFTTIFEIVGVDFNPGVVVSARIVVNGADFRGGELRLQRVYRNDVTKKIDYECVFIGSTKSLSSAIGEKHIGELDWSDYEMILDSPIITSSWQAYPEGGLTDGLFNGDILFPVVDFGNTYNGSYITNEPRIAVNHPSADGGSFDQSNHPIRFNRLKPMVRVREILTRMFEQNGFTLSGQFFTTNQEVQKMYLSAWGDSDDISVNVANGNLATLATNNGVNLDTDPLTVAYINYSNPVNDPGGNLTINANGGSFGPISYYTVPANGIYEYNVVAQLRFTHEVGTAAVYEITHTPPGAASNINYRISLTPGTGQCTSIPSEFRIEQDTGGGYVTLAVICGTEADSFNDGEGIVPNEYIYNYTLAENVTLPTATAGDIIYPWIWSVFPGSDVIPVSVLGGSYLEIITAVGQYNVSDGFNTKYKCIDFLKDIFTLFRMVMVPNPSDVNDFLLIPWSTYIGSGPLKDWSNKLVKNKDLVIRPLILDQKDRFVLSMAEDTDVYNTRNITVFDETFGTRQIDSVYDVLEGETKIETKLAPTPASQLEGYTAPWSNFTVPQIWAQDSEEGNTIHEPIKSKPRILYYNGLKSVAPDNWYMEDANQNPPDSFDEIPVVSFTDQMPQGGPNNRNLLFERETNWAANAGVYHPITGQDLYSRYWSSYINLIYNKDARRLTAYFVLDETDILNFQYSDVIYVEGVYYYVEKIYDAPLGKKAEVKVDLITLKDYRPRVTPVPPATMTLWEDVSANWEAITDNWENV